MKNSLSLSPTLFNMQLKSTKDTMSVDVPIKQYGKKVKIIPVNRPWRPMGL
jgi:hypothetical protein